MKINPYEVQTITQSCHQIIDVETHKIIASFQNWTDAENVCDQLNTRATLIYQESMESGFVMGATRISDMVEQFLQDMPKGESDSARPPLKLSEHVNRVRDEQRKAEGGGM